MWTLLKSIMRLNAIELTFYTPINNFNYAFEMGSDQVNTLEVISECESSDTRGKSRVIYWKKPSFNYPPQHGMFQFSKKPLSSNLLKVSKKKLCLMRLSHRSLLLLAAAKYQREPFNAYPVFCVVMFYFYINRVAPKPVCRQTFMIIHWDFLLPINFDD